MPPKPALVNREDCGKHPDGTYAKTNAELVDRVVQMAKSVGRPVATAQPYQDPAISIPIPSFIATGKRPVYTATLPPGRANAFCCFDLIRWNSQSKFGMALIFAMRSPTCLTKAAVFLSSESFSFLRI